jgi:hypothetical protein
VRRRNQNGQNNGEGDCHFACHRMYSSQRLRAKLAKFDHRVWRSF